MDAELTRTLIKELDGWRRVVILGLGNELGGDDGAGIHATREIKEVLPGDIAKVDIFETGVVPENYTGVLRRLQPSHVILIDSAAIGEEAGSLRIIATDDIQEIEKRIAQGDKEAEAVYSAMVYQIAKEAGAYAVVLKGDIDAVIITGGIAHSEKFVSQLKDWISFLCTKFFVYPGEGEMEALALGVLRVLRKEESAKEYT